MEGGNKGWCLEGCFFCVLAYWVEWRRVIASLGLRSKICARRCLTTEGISFRGSWGTGQGVHCDGKTSSELQVHAEMGILERFLKANGGHNHHYHYSRYYICQITR